MGAPLVAAAAADMRAGHRGEGRRANDPSAPLHLPPRSRAAAARPTQVEKVQYKNVTFTVWDVGGQEKLRPLW